MAEYKKVAITGTAPSWSLTPWNDPDMGILSLNDAYNIAGFMRADEWYDIHPLDKFWYAPKEQPGTKVVVFSHQVPVDQYVRPHGHLDWLAVQPFTRWVHPNHVEQCPASATWPNIRAFPKQEIEDSYGGYVTSSPQWMLAHCLLRGIREIHIYGIHLSTEQEYIDQRPGFEFMIGCLLGPTKRKLTRSNGLRRYESQDGLLILPEASPILSSDFQYAFQPSPRKALEPMKWELHKAEVKRNRVYEALKTARWPIARFEEPIPNDPKGATRTRTALLSTLQQELCYYEAMVQDYQDMIGRAARG